VKDFLFGVGIGTRADMRCVTSTLNSGWFLIKKSQSGWKHSMRQCFTKMFNADSCSFGSECKSAQINKLMALLIFSCLNIKLRHSSFRYSMPYLSAASKSRWVMSFSASLGEFPVKSTAVEKRSVRNQ
jgi:hypothetical protein